MATKPVMTEAIALTEKKMDMALDDIIKMSKNTGTKAKKQQRVPIKGKNVINNAVQDRSAKAQRVMNSRSSIRQGVLAQRRSQFQDNQFLFATEVAKNAAAASLPSRPFTYNRGANWKRPRFGVPFGQRRASNGSFGAPLVVSQQQQKQGLVSKQRPKTLDSLFANMKEQRMKILSHKNNNSVQRNWGFQQRPPWGRGRFAN